MGYSNERAVGRITLKSIREKHPQAVKVSHNFFAYPHSTKKNVTVYRHNHTEIAEVNTRKDEVTVHINGWNTMTTRAKLSEIPQFRGIPIWSKKDRLEIAGETVPTFGSATFKGREMIRSKRTRYDQLWDKFLKDLRQLKTIPLPELGDCLLCRMSVKECITSHIREGYYCGTMFIEALKDVGATPYTLSRLYHNGYDKHDRASAIKAIKKYVQSQLSKENENGCI